MTKKPRQGQVMILTIVALVIILILGSSLFTKTASFIGFNSRSIVGEQATQLAEAGLDYAIQKLNDTAGSFTSDNFTLSTGSVTVTVANKSQNLKTITATGYIPNSVNPRAKRTVKADVGIDNEQISFKYAVQSDTGGFSMGSSARVNGTVYTNGDITGGSSSVIDGDAYAVGNISTPAPNVTGIKNDNASPTPLPAFDANYWKTEANGGNDPSTCPPSSCTLGNVNLSGSQSYGPRKIQGNLTTSSSANITINGPIYVTGNITFGSSTIVQLNNSFGSSGTVIIADGLITIGSSVQVRPTTASPKGYIIIASTKTNLAIDQGSSAVSGILLAPNGEIRVGSSARITSLAANKITVGSSAILDYDEGLASAQFSSGPGGSWQIKKGTYRRTGSP